MTTTIPFEIMAIDGEGYHLIIKIHINGKVAGVVLDTGASKTVFDTTRITKYIKDKKVVLHGKLSTGLGSNTMKSYTTTLDKIKIGNLEIKNYKTVLLDLSHVNKSYQQVGFASVEGILGSDILVNHKAVIDFEKKVLKLKYKK